MWKFGPYDPSKVTAGSQPDWYMGWPDGLLRIIPPIETHLWGATVSWNVLIPIFVAPPTLLLVLLVLPFIEAWVTGDRSEHHLLQRPRDVPARTALMASLATFYAIAWAAGGNDIIALRLHLSINQITNALRVLIFVGPIVAFVLTKRWCISLQRHDNDRLLHGRETGVVLRSNEGGYTERHEPLDDATSFTLSNARREGQPSAVASPAHVGSARQRRLRTALARVLYADNVAHPAAEELDGHSPHERDGHA